MDAFVRQDNSLSPTRLDNSHNMLITLPKKWSQSKVSLIFKFLDNQNICSGFGFASIRAAVFNGDSSGFISGMAEDPSNPWTYY